MNGHADSDAQLELRPTDYLKSDNVHNKDTALVVLNCPIFDFDYFHRLYKHASFCIAADGGANHIHDLSIRSFPELERDVALGRAIPHAIHGDLDSIDPGVRKKYSSLGVDISENPDQYSTDFGKCIVKVVERMPHAANILVLGTLGGRVDQGIGLLHELYREQHFRHANRRFWLFSEASVSTLLQPGSTTVYTPLREGLITRNIGILPLYGAAVISTNGLEWDVTDWPTEMGGLVSTSNHVVSDHVHITTNRTVVFTIERATHGSQT